MTAAAAPKVFVIDDDEHPAAFSTLIAQGSDNDIGPIRRALLANSLSLALQPPLGNGVL
jgi:hypothetical protein